MSIYLRRYYKLIRYYINNPATGYTDTHHIRPSSFGGSNKSSNLIKLPPKAHYLAHWMLAKSFTKNKIWRKKMQWAFSFMAMDRHGQRKITSAQYEQSMKVRKLVMTESNPMKNPDISKLVSEKNKGRKPWNYKGPEERICLVCKNKFIVPKPSSKKITCGKSCSATNNNKRRTKEQYNRIGNSISKAKKIEERPILICSKCGHKQKRSPNFYLYHENNCKFK